MKNSCIKYGIYFVVIWNIFIAILSYVSFVFYNESIYDEIFGSAFDCSMAVFFIVLWSIIWYFVGYYGRKRFLAGRTLFKDKYPRLDSRAIDKYYSLFYLSKTSRLLMKVVLVSIPSYVLLHLEKGFSTLDFIAISLLCVLSVFLFYVSGKFAKKSIVEYN
ncbi:hypothetical protein QVO32_06195 [Bacteroides gallinaceum]|uniref:hypothetical protein n=1 Tax=Bacteroides gallinaceum TaxID=1462571 RepID=UPI0025AAB29D|nr:hypothetical protein [Bacteroides gallinaceum]MDN0079002.1 hypothetical protein [Bacteroides gallinaceum]